MFLALGLVLFLELELVIGIAMFVEFEVVELVLVIAMFVEFEEVDVSVGK